MERARTLTLLGVVTVAILSSYGVDGLCGYPSCPVSKPDHLNIHLVPHSHDDAGWLKTVDQYYYGDKNHIQLAAVQYTLDSVVEQLQKSPSRRFIYVETAFFWRWWTNQDEETQTIVRKLVNSGQLEFINGGWVMNDEATTHYNAIIDQMTLGLRYLNDTFGECALPRVAWQIDPFGHSREQASLFAQMGFDGLFFGRLDYQDKYNRRINQNMETVWSGSPNNLGKSSSLFTGALYNGYNPPAGYCFDIFCEDDPINDDPKLYDYNLDTKVENFIKIAHEWAAPYKTPNVLMTMGSDFQYMAAQTWYKNLDKLIKHVNTFEDQREFNSSQPRLNLIYSTPSCYLQEVHKSAPKLTTKTDDFFPYASDPHAFWTGYFTSRPTLKYYVHTSNNFLQVCKQLALAANNGKTPQGVLDKVFKLSESLAVLQHHDAVAGTAKQHVTNDYSKRLAMGTEQCDQVLDVAFGQLINDLETGPSTTQLKSNHFVRRFKNIESNRTFTFCHQLNISSCAASESMGDFVIAVYNPLARDLTNEYIRVPVPTPTWTVRGHEGLLSPQSMLIPKSVVSIPGRVSEAQYELIFKASVLPGLSITNFHLTRIEEDKHSGLRSQLKAVKRGGQDDSSNRKQTGDFWIQNSVGLGILFDGISGLTKKLKRGNTEIDLSQNFYFYKGMTGNNSKFEFRASGAYIFRPNTTEDHQPSPVTERVFSYFVYEGEHVTEVHQVYNEWLSQVIRLYDTADSVEFEWLVGPIPNDDSIGKELVTRYTSNLQTNGAFFTDSNGREILKRQRDQRSTWPYKVYENVAGNYYPVNSRMIITENAELTEGNGKTLILLNDRAQGGTSMNDGEIELMVHRRLLFDDAFGVGEALNEMAYGTGLVARGKHWIVLAGDKTDVPISIHRPLAQKVFMDKVMGFADANSLSSEKYAFMSNSVSKSPDLGIKQSLFTKLAQILPDNVHLLTLEPISPNQFILRLEHFYEKGEGAEYSKNVKISIQSLKECLPFISDLKETTLGANQWKNEAKRFDWTSPSNSTQEDDKGCPNRICQDHPSGGDAIILTPMQIKTFVVSVV